MDLVWFGVVVVVPLVGHFAIGLAFKIGDWLDG